MCKEGELNVDSIFVDIGSGLGKPNLHVALDPQVGVRCVCLCVCAAFSPLL